MKELTEEYSKQVFHGMYSRLREIQIDKKFEELVEQRRNLTFKCIKKDDDVFESMCRCIFAGGFRSIPDEEWNEIRKQFSDFRIHEVSQMEKWSLIEIFENFTEIRNWGKVIACIQNAVTIVGIADRYGSFMNYFRRFGEFEEDADKFLKLKNDLEEKFRYIGKATVYDFLRDIGCECIKPDVHARRICCRLGLLRDSTPSQENARELQEIGKRMSKFNESKAKIIDALFWLYGSGYRDVVRKNMAVCKRIPDCNRCLITECPSRR